MCIKADLSIQNIIIKFLAIDEFFPLIQKSIFNDRIRSTQKSSCQVDDCGIIELIETVEKLHNTILTMPVTYEQDGKGNDAIAYLHYFSANADWYITEKDIEGDVKQAFGFVVFGNMPEGAELGYISIEELTKNNFVELDFYFEPMTLKEIKSKHELI